MSEAEAQVEKYDIHAKMKKSNYYFSVSDRRQHEYAQLIAAKREYEILYKQYKTLYEKRLQEEAEIARFLVEEEKEKKNKENEFREYGL